MSPKKFKELAEKVKNVPKAFIEASQEVIDEISTEKVEKINQNKYHMKKKNTIVEGQKVTGGFHSTTPQDLFQEFGTGIIGQNNSHPTSSGSEYKTAHTVKRKNITTGEIEEVEADYWIYYKNGTFYSTKGQKAKKKICEAKEEAETEIGKKILDRIDKKLKGYN